MEEVTDKGENSLKVNQDGDEMMTDAQPGTSADSEENKRKLFKSPPPVKKLKTNAGTAVVREGKRAKQFRLPNLLRKMKTNERLAKVIQPKPALMLLHELKPSLQFRVSEPTYKGGVYWVEAIADGIMLGEGQGPTKNHAKHEAAERAMKNIVQETVNNPEFLYDRFCKIRSRPRPGAEKGQGGSQVKQEKSSSKDDKKIARPGTSAEGDSAEEDEILELDDRFGLYEILPWSSMASYALFKMFTDWKEEDGFELPAPAKPAWYAVTGSNAELPDNAALMHPVSLLNHMIPGLRAEELQRTRAPHSSVTVGYRIKGQLFTGTAANAKLARKIAAKHACKKIFDVECIDKYANVTFSGRMGDSGDNEYPRH